MKNLLYGIAAVRHRVFHTASDRPGRGARSRLTVRVAGVVATIAAMLSVTSVAAGTTTTPRAPTPKFPSSLFRNVVRVSSVPSGVLRKAGPAGLPGSYLYSFTVDGTIMYTSLPAPITPYINPYIPDSRAGYIIDPWISAVKKVCFIVCT